MMEFDRDETIELSGSSSAEPFVCHPPPKRINEPNGKAWATRYVYSALVKFLNGTALLSIDASPAEGIPPEKYDEILGLDMKGLGAQENAAAVMPADVSMRTKAHTVIQSAGWHHETYQ